MDIGEKIEALGADGRDDALDEILQIIKQFPEHTIQALEVFGEDGSPKALELIGGIMKNTKSGDSDDVALHCIDVLGRANSEEGLSDIFNYVNFFKVEPVDKLNRVLKALDTFRTNGSVQAVTLSKQMMENYPAVVPFRIDALKAQGVDGHADAIEELGEIASEMKGFSGIALTALRDIGSDHAIDVLEDSLVAIAENNAQQFDRAPARGGLSFDDIMKDLDIDPAPPEDDGHTSEGPGL